jgi:hypothetical protein
MTTIQVMQVVFMNISLFILLIDGIKNICCGNFSIGLIESNIAALGSFISSQ